ERPLTEVEADATADALNACASKARSLDVLVQFPSWFEAARRLNGARLIYDCIDLHSALPHMTAPIEEAERKLVQNAVLCVASSAPLIERLESLGATNTLLAPNAAPPPRLAEWPRQRADVIYVGAVEDWFDFALVDKLARAMPHVTVRIVGARAAP